MDCLYSEYAKWTEARVVVTVEDQNDNSPVFNSSHYSFTVPEGEAPGYFVGVVSSTSLSLAAIPTSNAAAQVRRNWADITEEVNPGAEEGFTLVQGRKRRRGSANSPTAAAPSSNPGGSRTIRRPQPSAHSVPRAQEIPTTRAHIAEARARQASSAEEHCVYLEHGPELQPFHYLRALDRLLGGTAGVVQVSKVNGHQLLGLANRGLAERLINNGLEVEGTLLRAFPFRKRAERITVGNLPFFVEDAAIIKALGPYGRITSIAPKMMKAGPYTYTDGRREAFIVLHEGVTTERLPTRLNITIKGEAWPAYLSSGIKCSRCHGQGHRRANCPLLAGRTTAPGPATPTSPTSVPPATAPRLPQQPSAQPPPPASPSPTMEVSDVPPTSRAALHPPAALRQSPPAPSALPAEDAPPAPPPVTPALSLRTPGSREPAAPTPDVEMSIVEETFASSTSSAKNATRVDLDAFIEKHPSVSFAGTDALGLGREEVLDLLSSRTKTQRKGPLLSPPQCDALAGLIRQILNLRPGAASNLYKVLGQVKAELRTTPAAVPPTPPLPAPRPAEPMLPTTHREELTPPLMTPPPPAPTDMEEDDPITEEERCAPPPPAPRLAGPIPPVPHGDTTTPAMTTPPPPLSLDRRWKMAGDLIHELSREIDLEHTFQSQVDMDDIVRAVLYPGDREPFIKRLPTRDRYILSGFINTAIWRARDGDPSMLESMSELRKLLSVDPTSGYLTTASVLDYEKAEFHVVMVMATDLGPERRQGSATVTLIVTDVEDERPRFQASDCGRTVGVAENDTPRDLLSVRAVDPDSRPRITYRLARGNATLFAVDPVSGTVRTRRPLDFESTPGGVLELAVGTVKTRMDVNDHAPQFMTYPLVLRFRLRDDSPPGTSIVVARAVDNDGTPPNNAVSYFLEEDSGLFRVNQSSGEVTLAGDLRSDPAREHQLTGTACDSLEVDENSPARTLVAALPVANVPDYPVTCSIVMGNEEERFLAEFGPDGCALRTKDQGLDFERRTQYNLTLRLDGLHDGALASTLATVDVLNVNDNPPQFVVPDRYRSAGRLDGYLAAMDPSATTGDVFLAVLRARDADAPPGGLRYGSADPRVAVHPTSGEVRSTPRLDSRTLPITVAVTVTDGDFQDVSHLLGQRGGKANVQPMWGPQGLFIDDPCKQDSFWQGGQQQMILGLYVSMSLLWVTGGLIYRLKAYDPDPESLTFGVSGEGPDLLEVRMLEGAREADVYLKAPLLKSEYDLGVFVTDGKSMQECVKWNTTFGEMDFDTELVYSVTSAISFTEIGRCVALGYCKFSQYCAQTTHVQSTVRVTAPQPLRSAFLDPEPVLSVPEDAERNTVVGRIAARGRDGSGVPATFEIRVGAEIWNSFPHLCHHCETHVC
ncbi:DCHS1 [Cordylochernes scorpioides]|uniref:DCHS1 n=1 Tax=Cordylochernes scorpioides TaxID=51811 RepID=A0ABY6JXQ9_9ARAC|nr:DCHS1 [Cordylochernes scorpioides]